MPVFIKNLDLHSTIYDLELYEAQVDIDTAAHAVMKYFDERPVLPGIILNSGGTYCGYLSRQRFFEIMSRPFSLELFYRHPLKKLLETLPPEQFELLSSSTLIVDAVRKALSRPVQAYYEPLVVSIEGLPEWKLLDTHTLLRAHSDIHVLAMQALREANEFKADLLRMASHDLKGPLSTILNIARLMEAELEADSELGEMSGQIQICSNHMLKLITELLNSSVIEAGRLDIKQQLLDLSELCRAIYHQYHWLAIDKEQDLLLEIEASTNFAIVGDAIKLREAMENLLSNAIKYSPRNKPIRVQLYREGDAAVYSVVDEGPGISAEDRKKMFQKFQRLTARPTGDESSTGLGLYISREIVELHGGTITVKSELKKGSTFSITIPLARSTDVQNLLEESPLRSEIS